MCTAQPLEADSKLCSADSRDRGENTNDLSHSFTEKDDREAAARDSNSKSGVKHLSEKLWYDVYLDLFFCSNCYDKQLMKGMNLHHQHAVFFDLLQDVCGKSTQFCEQHKYQVKEQWCDSCLMNVCAVCALLNHRTHRVTPLAPDDCHTTSRERCSTGLRLLQAIFWRNSKSR